LSVRRRTFLHLSDIHFKREISASILDLDQDVRNELQLDLAREQDGLGQFDGILITGDIAFAGEEQEYAIALSWLQELSEILHCPEENVWTTPGNHDVDRSSVVVSKLLRAAHTELRSCDPAKVDATLIEYLQDADTRGHLFKPIEKYNAFASKFLCNVSADSPYWAHDIDLNDGSKLRLRGVNSTIVSDQFDNDAANKLLVGRVQATLTRQNGVAYAVLCHHPPTWLLDHDSVTDLWNERASLQLFGHKHKQRINQVNNSLLLVAGATHPSRREPNWTPGYNILQIWVEGADENRRLRVDVRPRVWSETESRFQPNFDTGGHDVRSFELPLDRWTSLGAQEGASELDEPGEITAERSELPMGNSVAAKDASTEQVLDPDRRLAYRFLILPYQKRIAVALSLGLLEDEDSAVADAELYKRLFRRAREQGKLEALWEAVEIEHAGESAQPDPYEGR
jgi:predicted MPP superfamily phosphohydrolase